jgi:hypothetical protein
VRYFGIVLLSSLLVVGCVSAPSRAVQEIKDADEQMVANCKFLANVVGNCTMGPGAKGREQIARRRAREHALELGATHVVWIEGNAGYSATRVEARAYRCP